MDGEKKERNRKILWAVCFLAAVCSFSGETFARYIQKNKTGMSQITTENFYFTTNLLGDTVMVPLDGQELGDYAFGEKSTEGIWYLNGSEAYDIDIQVQNYYDELRITEKTITYEVEASVWRKDGTEITDSGVQVKKENTAVVNGVLTGGISSQDKITVEIPGHEAWAYEDGTEVRIKIKSISPYTKTLTQKFLLYVPEDTMEYEVRDQENSLYAELLLMTEAPKGVQPYLVWSDELYIDNTNSLTWNLVNGQFQQQAGIEERDMQVSEPVVMGQSESIYFFKKDPSENYAREKTTVSSSEGRYQIKIGK